MKNKNIIRKGFTLIELLLVIVVIAILAGTVMVSGDESVISAEANNIINNMRILKTAALEWLADYSDFVDHGHAPADFHARPYQITYPLTYVTGAGGSNPDVRGQAKKNIQHLMHSDANGRDTMMKYIHINPMISINERESPPYAKEEGDSYSIVDSSGAWNGTFTGDCRKWFICYKFSQNSTRATKLKKKIKERAEEFGLLKDENTPYDGNATWVYMKIVDLEEYFGKK